MNDKAFWNRWHQMRERKGGGWVKGTKSYVFNTVKAWIREETYIFKEEYARVVYQLGIHFIRKSCRHKLVSVTIWSQMHTEKNWFIRGFKKTRGLLKTQMGFQRFARLMMVYPKSKWIFFLTFFLFLRLVWTENGSSETQNWFLVGLGGFCAIIMKFNAHINILQIKYPKVIVKQWVKLRFKNQIYWLTLH